MILKSFGCSFIAGHELSDFAHDSPSQLTYPALLAKHFGMRYQCHAEATSGNLRILHRVIDELENDSNANLYLIQWSFSNRYDLTLTADNQNHSWKSILPSDRDDITTAYYRYIHSEYRDILLSLMHWSTALQALQNSQHKFLMIAVDDTLTLSKWRLDPVMQHFRYRLNDHIKKFDGRPWFDWCVDNAWPMGMAKHPLEQAHYQTFQYILGKNWFQTAKS